MDSTPEILKDLRQQQKRDTGKSPYATQARSTAIEKILYVKDAPNYSLVTGNLYLPGSWAALDQNAQERGISDYGLIVGKPDGAFRDRFLFNWSDCSGDEQQTEQRRRVYSGKFLRLLNRAYTRLSPQRGMLFTEVPEFIADTYLEPFVDLAKTEGKIDAEIEDHDFWSGRKLLFMEKNHYSAPDLEALVLPHFRPTYDRT